MSDPLATLGALEGVPSAIAAARSAVDAVLRDRGRRQVSAEQVASALVAGARASVAIEQRRAGGGPDWTAGAARLQAELPRLAGLLTVSPGQALARAHVLLARGEVGDAAGRLRADPAVPVRMQDLHGLLGAAARTPAIVLAAIAHAEIAVVAPFGAGDGVLARAVEHMVLIATGVDPQCALVPEAGHLRVGEAYDARLTAYADGSVTGVRDWILHCATAVAHGAEVSPLAART